jgi:hypothetical protein
MVGVVTLQILAISLGLNNLSIIPLFSVLRVLIKIHYFVFMNLYNFSFSGFFPKKVRMDLNILEIFPLNGIFKQLINFIDLQPLQEEW